MICPLCKNSVTHQLPGFEDVSFWKCEHCNLLFKDPSNFPTPELEVSRYKEHNNTPECPGYVDFLNKAVKPTLPFLEEDMEGLDFGCGPNSVLSMMVKDAGFECSYYDPFFFPELPDSRMDFIFATECFEHFFDPAKELRLITSLLIPSGTITIMTQRWDDETNPAKWWYAKDETHVCFFHDKTFEYIANKYGYSIEFDDGKNVIILRKIVAWEN